MREAARVLASERLPAPPSPQPVLRWAAALGATGRVLATVSAGRGTPRILSAWSARLLRALAVEVEVAGRIPRAQLWVANHLSWLDPMVLMALRPMGTLAKAEVAAYPFIGRGAVKAGLRFVDRRNPVSRAAALAAFAADLRAGRELLLFPEGTTTQGRGLAPLWTGGLRAAHALGVRVAPLRLECAAPHYPWTGDQALLPHLHGLARTPSTQIRIVPGEALDRAGCPDAEDFLHRVRLHLEPRPRETHAT